MTAPTSPATADSATPPRAGRTGGGRLGRWGWIAGIALAVAVVLVASTFASSDPDGLERVAEDAGFLERATNVIEGLLADYAIPGVDNAWLASVLSGLLGIAIVVGVILVVGRLVARRRA